MVWETYAEIPKLQPSVPDLADWQSQNQAFDGLSGYSYNGQNYNLNSGDESKRLLGAPVSANLFPLLGVSPLLGRSFSDKEDQAGNNHVVILSHTLWQNQFNSDREIIGKALNLNGESYTVVAVMPPKFQFPEWAELWTPLSDLTADYLTNRVRHPIEVIGRLKAGVTLQQAQAEMDTISSQLQQEHQATNKGISAMVVSLREEKVGKVRPVLLILLGAVGFVLLIACVNVANLQLARSITRQREIAVRVAVGANPLRLVVQLLTEGLLLSTLGALVGIALAFSGLHFLKTLSLISLVHPDDIKMDLKVLAFTLLLAILTGIVFGLVPALQTLKVDVSKVLKEGAKRASSGSGSHRLRNILVISEVALALVLLIGAGLLMRSLVEILHIDPGFNPQNVITMDISLPPMRYEEDNQITGFYEQLLQKLQGVPGVENVSLINNLPLGSESTARTRFVIEGRPAWEPGNLPVIQLRMISPDYFRTLRIPLVKGRFFENSDTEDRPLVAIINETMARRFWPDEDPINHQIAFGRQEQHGPNFLIVGVVGDVKHFGLDKQAEPEAYVPYLQSAFPDRTLLVRTSFNLSSIVSVVKDKVSEIDRNQPIYNIRTMDSLLSASLFQRRQSMIMLVCFAGLALVLAAIGVYGLISYSVGERAHEIGIRMALGAQAGDILKLIMRQALTLTLVGVASGLVMSFVLTRLLGSLLYGVSAYDPLTFASVALVLVGVGLLASFLPAQKAMKTNPINALRHD
jgi:putative ABC transport system permease protein